MYRMYKNCPFKIIKIIRLMKLKQKFIKSYAHKGRTKVIRKNV